MGVAREVDVGVAERREQGVVEAPQNGRVLVAHPRDEVGAVGGGDDLADLDGGDAGADGRRDPRVVVAARPACVGVGAGEELGEVLRVDE